MPMKEYEVAEKKNRKHVSYQSADVSAIHHSKHKMWMHNFICISTLRLFCLIVVVDRIVSLL